MATIVASQAQLSRELNLSTHVLRIAKRIGGVTAGFNPNNTINKDMFEAWWNIHKDEVLNVGEDTLNKWKTRKTKADALISEIELDELKKNTLDKAEVVSFLKSISSAQMAALKSKLTMELPPRLLGLGVTEMSVIMDQTVKEVCEMFQKEMTRWN